MKSPLTIGCIGTGAMGGALLCGLARPQNYTLLGYNRSPEALEQLEVVGVVAQESAAELARHSDIIILAVKPNGIQGVIEQILPELTPDKILVSVASVIKTSELLEWTKGACPCVRLIPNTTALVGAGLVGICFDDPKLSEENKGTMLDVFSEVGRTVILPEQRIHEFTAVFACGPGYLYHIMESIVEAAVTLGFPRAESIELTAAMFHGAGKLAEESGLHPAILREQVCSPGGITISGINHMDRTAMRGHLIDTIHTADHRAREMEAAREREKSEKG